MRIGVTSGGTSGSVHRLGIYDTAADGTPGSLILDAGTVATTTTGDKEITGLSAQLTPGLYWLTAVQQGAPSTPATIRTLTESDYGPSSAASNAAGGWYEAGATGALPATYTGDTVGGVVPLVSIKAA